MPDSFFNVVIFLVPLVIFIARFVSQLGKNQEAPPRIPVHFEDDREDFFPGEEISKQTSPREDGHFPYALSRGASEYFKGNAAKTRAVNTGAERVPRIAASRKTAAVVPAGEQPRGDSAGGSSFASPQAGKKPLAPNSSSGGLAFDFARLSPLQQAVIMSEILGPPKGL